jgi:hypothetical protein
MPSSWKRAAVRVQPGRLLLVQTPIGEHHPGERQRRDEHRHPRRLETDAPAGARLYGYERFCQIVAEHVRVNDLTLPIP